MSQKIRELMTREPVSVPATASVGQAAQAMRDHDIGDVLVTDEGRLVGLLTDRDLVVRVLAAEADGADGADGGAGGRPRTAGEACTRNVTSLSPDDDVDQAVEMMRVRALRRLPVVEHDRLVGIVSLGDLAEKQDPASVLGRISAAAATR